MAGGYPDQIKKAQKTSQTQGDREKLIVKYAYLVNYIAGRMIHRLPPTVHIDELKSAGYLGLIDAIDKFDETRDVSLQTYSRFRIKGAMLDELRSMDWFSRSLRKKAQDVQKAIRKVELRTSATAQEEEVADELGIELSEYQKILSDVYSNSLLDLDSFIRDRNNDSSSGRSFKDQLKSGDNPAEHMFEGEMKEALGRGIKKLSEKEQVVVSLYYYDELTLKEIGEVLSLTESRICQIHTAAVMKLKNKIKSYFEG